MISAADCAHPMATAWRSVQRSSCASACVWASRGEGMELARALAMSTYRSPEEFAARFRAPPHLDGPHPVFPVEQYLYARGRDYAARYRPESFLSLSESIDLHRVDAAAISVRTEWWPSARISWYRWRICGRWPHACPMPTCTSFHPCTATTPS